MFFIIRQVTIATIITTISQPKLGIQKEPKFPPTKSVPIKYTKKERVNPTANCNAMPAQNHLLFLISAFIAPIAAKHGGVNKLNIKNASAATFVIANIAATSLAPLSKISSATLIKLVTP